MLDLEGSGAGFWSLYHCQTLVMISGLGMVLIKFIDLRFGNPFLKFVHQLHLTASSHSQSRWMFEDSGEDFPKWAEMFPSWPLFSSGVFDCVYSFSICMKSQLHPHCESTSKWNPIQFLHLFFDVFGTVACPHAQSDHCLHDWIQETSLSASSEKITQVNGALCTAAGILTSVPGFAQWSTCHVHPSSSCNGEMEEAPLKKILLVFHNH